jgi:predicted ATPase/DNA-binding XRE family transcriptional regulator
LLLAPWQRRARSGGLAASRREVRAVHEQGKSSFGELLRRHRRAAGLSQDALAERAKMSTEGISALERGYRRSPQRETLALLAGALALDGAQRRVFEETAARANYSRGGASVTVGPWKAAESSLPLALSAFLGRDAELHEIAAIVASHRLVTITGAAGVGKTQTALQLARTYEGTDGVRFAGLAAIRDGSLVLPVIAAALGLQEDASRPLADTVVAYLKNKALLLVLDNCEHVIDRAARVAEELLANCARLRILATSREALMAEGERRYQLPSLDDADAAALFADRARAVDARFRLSGENAADVAEICHRLDNIPLAIELAAARVNLLPARELRKKLDDRFELLTGSGRTTEARQRTMRAAIDWSYELLSDTERRVFERLAIFAGGCTLAAATSVCAGEDVAEADVFDAIGWLVDKSLVTVELGWSETRYGLLQSFAQYGREKLLARQELEAVAHRHALAALEIAKRVSATRAHYFEPAQEIAIAEQENLRTAIAWALIDGNDVPLGRWIVTHVCYWEYFSVRERQRWLDAALLPRPRTSPDLLAALHKARTIVCFHLRDYEASLESCEAALAYYRTGGDVTSISQMENARGHALDNLRRHSDAKAVFEAALPGARAGSPTALAGILSGLALLTDDVDEARRFSAEAQRIHESSGNSIGVAYTLLNLGILERRAGNAERSLEKEMAALAAASGLAAFARINVTTLALHNIAHTLIDLERYDEAAQRVREKMDLARESGLDYYVALGLEELVTIDSQRRDSAGGRNAEWFLHAAKALGYADAFRTAARAARYESSKPQYDALLARLHDAIGAERTAQLMREGAALTQDQAIAEAAALQT